MSLIAYFQDRDDGFIRERDVEVQNFHWGWVVKWPFCTFSSNIFELIIFCKPYAYPKFNNITTTAWWPYLIIVWDSIPSRHASWVKPKDDIDYDEMVMMKYVDPISFGRVCFHYYNVDNSWNPLMARRVHFWNTYENISLSLNITFCFNSF